jgi:hypothetical protein
MRLAHRDFFTAAKLLVLLYHHRQNMRRRIKILNVTAIVFLIIQALSYAGSLGGKDEIITNTPELIGYYLGFNLPLIIAIILFIISFSQKRKLQKMEERNMIDSIGRAE